MMRFYCSLRLLVASIFLLFCSSAAQADLLRSNPQEVCWILTDLGFHPSNWDTYSYSSSFKADDTDVYYNQGCIGGDKDIGSWSVTRPNDVAFRVIGLDGIVTQVKLVLNVYDATSAASSKSARIEFISIVQELVKRMNNHDLPSEMITNIQDGKDFKKIIGNTSYTLVHDNWPNGRGYELRFISY